jgi:tetraacyldisaccharide 4'-kinase
MSALKTPSFWYRPPSEEPSMSELVLTPVSQIYEALYHWHQSSKTPYKAGIPVICIGNIVAGGTGKTPTAVALMHVIKEIGLAKNPHFLIRGYGGSETGPVLVDPLMHSAWEVGDEALILVQDAPTVVAADRAAGVQFAERRGADLILMDDGLQNPGIHKDLKLVVVNGEMGFGNQKLMPAGPLRQPLIEGLIKADAYIVIGEDKRNIAALLPAEKSVIRARLVQDEGPAFDKETKYIAFAGLGYPDKFFNFLKETVQLNVVECIRFADHCPYEEHDMKGLKARALTLGARLITTEKDSLRIPGAFKDDIDIMPVKMTFDDADDLAKLLQGARMRNAA